MVSFSARRNLRESFQRVQSAKEDTVQEFPGVLVGQDSTTSAEVASKPGWVWWQEIGGDGNAAWALNAEGIEATPGMPVIVRKSSKTGQWEIAAWRPDLVAEMPDWNGELPRQRHGADHLETGRDPIPPLNVTQLAPFKCYPDGVFTVAVGPGWYEGQFFGGEQGVDLSGYTPDTGKKRYVAVAVNPADSDPVNWPVETTLGDQTANNPTLHAPLPAFAAGRIPVAYVLLYDGQANIRTGRNSDIIDPRQIVDAIPAGGGGGGSGSANRIGQILLSIDGLTFTAITPMINADAHIAINQDGHIMVADWIGVEVA